MLSLQKSLMQNVTNQTGRPPHMHNTKASFVLFFLYYFRSLELRHHSINLFELLINPILLCIDQAFFNDPTREVMTSSSHSSDRSANQDHVLQQTDATPTGEGSHDTKVLIVCDRCGGVVEPDIKKPKKCWVLYFCSH